MPKEFQETFRADPAEESQKDKNSDAPDLPRRKFLKGLVALAGVGVLKGLESRVSATTVEDKEENIEAPELSKEILQEVEKYARYLDVLLFNMGSPEGEKRLELPVELINRVNEIFSGPLEPLRSWNNEMFDKGIYSHLAGYMLQDFRNSEIAGEIARIYHKLSEEQKINFEQKVKAMIANPIVYDLLFKISMKPVLFDPREVPGNSVKEEILTFQKTKETHYKIKDERGNIVFSGTNNMPVAVAEGNFAHLYDEKGKDIIRIVYYANAQPSFFFPHFDEQGKETKESMFKTYLGQKGKFLFIEEREGGMHKENYDVSLNDDQIEALQKFFTCDIGSGPEAKPFFRW